MLANFARLVPYAMVLLLILWPEAYRKMYRRIRPTVPFVGRPYTDSSMRLTGLLMLAFFLFLEFYTRRQ
jgi:hypothetical protein